MATTNTTPSSYSDYSTIHSSVFYMGAKQHSYLDNTIYPICGYIHRIYQLFIYIWIHRSGSLNTENTGSEILFGKIRQERLNAINVESTTSEKARTSSRTGAAAGVGSPAATSGMPKKPCTTLNQTDINLCACERERKRKRKGGMEPALVRARALLERHSVRASEKEGNIDSRRSRWVAMVRDNVKVLNIVWCNLIKEPGGRDRWRYTTATRSWRGYRRPPTRTPGSWSARRVSA